MRSLPGDMAYRIAASRYWSSSVDSSGRLKWSVKSLQVGSNSLRVPIWHWLTDRTCSSKIRRIRFRKRCAVIENSSAYVLSGFVLASSLADGVDIDLRALGCCCACEAQSIDSVFMGLSSCDSRLLPVCVIGDVVLFCCLLCIGNGFLVPRDLALFLTLYWPAVHVGA